MSLIIILIVLLGVGGSGGGGLSDSNSMNSGSFIFWIASHRLWYHWWILAIWNLKSVLFKQSNYFNCVRICSISRKKITSYLWIGDESNATSLDFEDGLTMRFIRKSYTLSIKVPNRAYFCTEGLVKMYKWLCSRFTAFLIYLTYKSMVSG